MLQKLLLVLTIASWIYWFVALLLVYNFFRNQPQPNPDFTPPVSILKPVKGVDAEAYCNFVSFCQQDYPAFELLFGVANPNDPVVPLIERLQREYPEYSIRLVIAEAFGANEKACLLHHLAEQARHDVLVASDSDMRATPDYLRRVVAPLADARVGLVTCPYRGEEPLTFTAKLEALHMGATFLPSVIVARKFLSMRFATGATVALRRETLERMGGFAVLADYLADDYQLGVRIAELGLQVRLSDYVMASVLGATNFREQWDREVRWARCARVSRPREYPGMLLTFSTPLAFAFALASGLSPAGLRTLLFSILLRWVVAWLVANRTGDHQVHRWLLWLPVRDMLSALVWVAAGFGRHIIWRGVRYVVEPDGRMRPVAPAAQRPAEGGHLWRT